MACGWHTLLPVQGWGWADTVSQGSVFSPKSSWEVQCQFCSEKARLQGLFSPLRCTVPCTKYSAPIPTGRTILVFLPTNCPYLTIDYKRAWRELWWCDLRLSNCLLNPSCQFSSVEDMNSSLLLWCKVWESILKSAPTNCCYTDGISTRGICTLQHKLLQEQQFCTYSSQTCKGPWARLHGSTPSLQACSSCLERVTCKHHLKLTYFLLHEASSINFTCPNNPTGKENATWLPQRSKLRQNVQNFKFGSFLTKAGDSLTDRQVIDIKVAH